MVEDKCFHVDMETLLRRLKSKPYPTLGKLGRLPNVFVANLKFRLSANCYRNSYLEVGGDKGEAYGHLATT